ncbi:MAG: AAA family ATPase [Candidatus Sericytochromatia bacterium]
MTAGVACGSCGTALRQNAKFCDECGAATAVSHETAEYKQVTALFADVVRSMDIAAAVDMERYREIVTELVKRSVAVVHRYGGGKVEYTGDGVMALFGAPVALEDHAFRACLAALDIQEEAKRLAVEVSRRDGVALRLRVGLNSGRVIAGSGSLGYAAIGEQIGFAQRMESVAPPGGVMLSESTARLVEHLVILGEPESVHIKGSDEPVPAHRLMAVGPRHLLGRSEGSLVGRRWEILAIEAILNWTIGGRGGVVRVVGPPGIGKSRIAREGAALAAGRGVDVIWSFCESHARDIPFHAMTQWLRAASGVIDLDPAAARIKVRQQIADADADDLLLLEDLLGIADPDVALPQIDPDARRRRLGALINAASLARREPALFIIEDAHWIDEVSESMLADLLSVVPQTPAMVLLTCRPEYQGALIRVTGAQTIALAPLADSDTEALLGELLGADPSVRELAAIVAERAAGNPFFAEEMVRELSQRGVLAGERGGYICHADIEEVSVPATVQAAIEARIDRLTTAAKQTLNAASVIGARFDTGLLAAMGIDAAVDEPLSAELIEQVRFTPSPEYVFRHPLIRAVAYESQLKSDRAHWHRLLAEAIQDREPTAVDENAALIAEHLQSAGELHSAYGWHMRAGAWSAKRDPRAARVSWERARRVADALPDDPDRLSMRIAPRTMLCVTIGWGAVHESRHRFEELRELCSAAGDKISLAIGMTGLATELLYSGRSREGSRLVSEQMALLESIGDPTLTMGLAFLAFCTWFDAGEFDELLRWCDTVVGLAAGDSTKGADFGMGSPLAAALAWRGFARSWLGRPGWRQDLDEAVDTAHQGSPETLAAILAWTYGSAIQYGLLRANDSTVHALELAVRNAAASSNVAIGLAKYTLGVALLNRDAAADRYRGLGLMDQARDIFLTEHGVFMLPIADLWTGRENARRGERGAVIPAMRQAVDELLQGGRLGYGVWGTAVLAEALLERRAEGDLAEAEEAIDRLADLRADQQWIVRDITLLRLRTLLARIRGEDAAYQDSLDRYRAMAESLGFEGHMAWAEAMARAG